MILGAEIAIILYGLYALFTGKFSIGKGRIVTGSKARILGFICLLPLPLAFGFGLTFGFFFAFVLNQTINPLVSTFIEIFIFVTILILVTLLGRSFYEEQEEEISLQNEFN